MDLEGEMRAIVGKELETSTDVISGQLCMKRRRKSEKRSDRESPVKEVAFDCVAEYLEKKWRRCRRTCDKMKVIQSLPRKRRPTSTRIRCTGSCGALKNPRNSQINYRAHSDEICHESPKSSFTFVVLRPRGGSFI
jgi:hypothetical protein